ncbi:Uncharacterised protein [uncultured archaeon]|nr:Uncharacterised protein [uncultured archaeon]
MASNTTIIVHKETRERLASLKEYTRESYDEVINKLITIFEKMKSEGELTEETKKEIVAARRQIKEGKGMSTKELVERLGL